MSDDLRNSISSLSPQQLRQVLVALQLLLNMRIREIYADDAEAAAELHQLANPSDTESALDVLAPDIPKGSYDASEDKLRSFLLALADIPAFEPLVRRATERRLLASFPGVDPILLATIVTLALSIKWRLKIRRKDGKLDFTFEAEKAPTPVAFIRSILGLPGAARSDDKP